MKRQERQWEPSREASSTERKRGLDVTVELGTHHHTKDLLTWVFSQVEGGYNDTVSPAGRYLQDEIIPFSSVYQGKWSQTL